jgi:hypothetical protein
MRLFGQCRPPFRAGDRPASLPWLVRAAIAGLGTGHAAPLYLARHHPRPGGGRPDCGPCGRTSRSLPW